MPKPMSKELKKPKSEDYDYGDSYEIALEKYIDQQDAKLKEAEEQNKELQEQLNNAVNNIWRKENELKKATR